MQNDVAIIVPSRIDSKRLPRKALVEIGNKTMIEHVISSLSKLCSQNLYIATDSQEIFNIVEFSTAVPIMTDKDCKSGSDRVFQALKKIPNNQEIKYVINVQGDMPFVSSELVLNVISELKKNDSDIVTSAVKVDKDQIKGDSNVTVVVDREGKAMYFSRRNIPHGANTFLYHVGIYGFKKSSLEKFVSLKKGYYENLEKLEQLRAIENGMKIKVCQCNEIPISVDNNEDLDKAINYINNKKIV